MFVCKLTLFDLLIAGAWVVILARFLLFDALLSLPANSALERAPPLPKHALRRSHKEEKQLLKALRKQQQIEQSWTFCNFPYVSYEEAMRGDSGEGSAVSGAQSPQQQSSSLSAATPALESVFDFNRELWGRTWGVGCPPNKLHYESRMMVQCITNEMYKVKDNVAKGVKPAAGEAGGEGQASASSVSRVLLLHEPGLPLPLQELVQGKLDCRSDRPFFVDIGAGMGTASLLAASVGCHVAAIDAHHQQLGRLMRGLVRSGIQRKAGLFHAAVTGTRGQQLYSRMAEVERKTLSIASATALVESGAAAAPPAGLATAAEAGEASAATPSLQLTFSVESFPEPAYSLYSHAQPAVDIALSDPVETAYVDDILSHPHRPMFFPGEQGFSSSSSSSGRDGLAGPALSVDAAEAPELAAVLEQDGMAADLVSKSPRHMAASDVSGLWIDNGGMELSALFTARRLLLEGRPPFLFLRLKMAKILSQQLGSYRSSLAASEEGTGADGEENGSASGSQLSLSADVARICQPLWSAAAEPICPSSIFAKGSKLQDATTASARSAGAAAGPTDPIHAVPDILSSKGDSSFGDLPEVCSVSSGDADQAFRSVRSSSCELQAALESLHSLGYKLRYARSPLVAFALQLNGTLASLPATGVVASAVEAAVAAEQGKSNKKLSKKHSQSTVAESLVAAGALPTLPPHIIAAAAAAYHARKQASANGTAPLLSTGDAAAGSGIASSSSSSSVSSSSSSVSSKKKKGLSSSAVMQETLLSAAGEACLFLQEHMASLEGEAAGPAAVQDAGVPPPLQNGSTSSSSRSAGSGNVRALLTALAATPLVDAVDVYLEHSS